MSILRPLVNALAALAGARAAAGAQAAGGIEGELLVSEVHGKYGARAAAGMMFIASTALAGATIPVNAASLVSVFTIQNPAGSGVNLELAKFQVGVGGTTAAVIGDLALAFQTNGTALATTTAGTIQNALVGSGKASKANYFTAATYTGTPTVLDILGIGFGTTAAGAGPLTAVVDLDGSIVVPPGTTITIVGNVAQTQPFDISLSWIEVPV